VENSTEKPTNNMKTGKLYKSKISSLIVECTKYTIGNITFSGIVRVGNKEKDKDEQSDYFLVCTFDEYNLLKNDQVGGSHYKDLKIQPTEFIHANNIPFVEGNIIKYVVRHRSKNGIEDLKKARHYIDLLIQLEYETTKVI
jgi:hypothetical protein